MNIFAFPSCFPCFVYPDSSFEELCTVYLQYYDISCSTYCFCLFLFIVYVSTWLCLSVCAPFPLRGLTSMYHTHTHTHTHLHTYMVSCHVYEYILYSGITNVSVESVFYLSLTLCQTDENLTILTICDCHTYTHTHTHLHSGPF